LMLLFLLRSPCSTLVPYTTLFRSFAQILAANPKDGVATVIGHTDRIGSEAYNQSLSEQRARTVADYLIAKGLFADKVRAEGRGEDRKSTRLNSSHVKTSYAVFCLK